MIVVSCLLVRHVNGSFPVCEGSLRGKCNFIIVLRELKRNTDGCHSLNGVEGGWRV